MQWQRPQLAASVDLRLRQDLWERPGKDLVVSTNVNISEEKAVKSAGALWWWFWLLAFSVLRCSA